MGCLLRGLEQLHQRDHGATFFADQLRAYYRQLSGGYLDERQDHVLGVDCSQTFVLAEHGGSSTANGYLCPNCF